MTSSTGRGGRGREPNTELDTSGLRAGSVGIEPGWLYLTKVLAERMLALASGCPEFRGLHASLP
jgi:hypothetical protein